MKTIRLFAGVAALLCALSLTSCSKEENDSPITCYYEYADNSPIDFVRMSTRNQTANILIKGGDGSYRFSNENAGVIAVENYRASGLTLTALAVGESVITISDDSGNTTRIQVKVAVQETSSEFKPQRCLIYGDGLTEKEVTDLKKELLFVPSWKLDFKFTFDASNVGSATMAPQEVDGMATKTYAFEFDPDASKIAPFYPLKINTQVYGAFLLTSDDEQLLLLSHRALNESNITPGSRMNSSPIQPSFTLDVASRYKVRYPNLERAYLMM